MENTWKDSFTYDFDQRIGLMSSCLDFTKINSIIDLGCGKQDLRKFILPDVHYYGYDLHPHCQDTIITDFNNGGKIGNSAQVAFCSGVFEYIYDIKKFVDNICNHCDTVLASYNFLDDVTERNPIWVNSYKKVDLYQLFKNNGFEFVEEFYCGNHTIFIFSKNAKVDYIKYNRIKQIKKCINVLCRKYEFFKLINDVMRQYGINIFSNKIEHYNNKIMKKMAKV